MFNFKKEKGITILALVITVVVIFILSAVVIRITLSDSGVIDRAKDAVDSYDSSADQEEEGLKDLSSEIEEKTANRRGNGAFSISNKNIGDYVDVGTKYLDEGEYKENETDWRIFYVDGNDIYLIFSKLLPAKYAPSDITTYGDYSYGDAGTMTSSVLKNNNKWRYVLPEKYKNDSLISITGSPDIELWVKSWNAKGYMNLTAEYITETRYLSTGFWPHYTTVGYEIYSTDSPDEYRTGFDGGYFEVTLNGYIQRNNDEDYTLYFPYGGKKSLSEGYFTSSNSTYAGGYPVVVNFYKNTVGVGGYANTFGIRPVIKLPRDYFSSKSNDVWKLK